MVDMDDIEDRINAVGPSLTFKGVQTEDSLALLESKLALEIPPNYRIFLSKWGAGGYERFFLSGIINNDPLKEESGSVYNDILICREDYGLPSNYFVLYIDRNEEIVWGINSKNGKVVVWDNLGQSDEDIYEDFSDFLDIYIDDPQRALYPE
jgi:antitoxin YobK